MGDLCSDHVLKVSLKQQPVVEVCPDLNEEGVMFTSFKMFSKCRTHLWGYSKLIHQFKVMNLNLCTHLSLENIFLCLHVLLLQSL